MNASRRTFACPPTFYDVTYSINPWMDPTVPVDRNVAWRQWTRVMARLDELGDTLAFIEPARGCPDMVFLGDAGIVCGDRFLCSRFRFAERAAEAAHYEKAFADAGLDVVTMREGAVLEGLGDVAIAGDRAILGYGPRSNAAGFAALGSFAPWLRIIAEVQLPDPRFYHLATAVVFLDPHTVMYAPQGLTREGVAAIEAAVPRTLAVGDRDVFDHQACNCIVIGQRVLIDGCSPDLRAALAELGFTAEIFPASELKKGGGSVRCLVLPEIAEASR